MRSKTVQSAIFGVLGALMFASKMLLEFLPNVHLIGVFVIAITVVYRKKALYPIYTFVLLTGLYGGFAPWWVAYLYVWTVLWGVVMLLPKNMPQKVQIPVYMTICGLHGLLFGTLFAPVQALFYGLNFNATITWIIAGLPWDLIHGVSNFLCAVLVLPIIKALRVAEKNV